MWHCPNGKFQFNKPIRLAIYVLESSNSRRLTYFMPPLVSGIFFFLSGIFPDFPQNLIPLLCIRPMRLFLSAGTVRRVRIILLRATHLPFVALIWAYESKWGSKNNLLMSTRQGTSGNPTRSQDPHLVVETNRLQGKSPSVDQQAARELDMGRVGQVPQLADLIDTIERLRTQVEAMSQ
jgi:hypothetical protein